MKPNLDIQGHRGCRGLFPENSLPAFQKAIELGVTTLELDIVVSQDHQVVLSHEPYMSREICLMPDGALIPDSMDMDINLYKLNYTQIKEFDCGSKKHSKFPKQIKLATYKPLLEEVFELTNSLNPQVRFNIEIKSKPEYYVKYTPEPKEYVKIVLESISKAGVQKRCTIQSFDLKILEEVKSQDNSILVALLVDENETINQKQAELSFKPEIISPYFKLLNKELIFKKQEEGFKIIPWTVNKVGDMQQLLKWGVDGIITDYPDRLLKIIHS